MTPALAVRGALAGAWGDFQSPTPHEAAGLDEDARRAWARARLVERVDEEVAGLEAHRESLDFESIEQDRLEAGDRALFDPSTEACLARRYEAEARRGFFRRSRSSAGPRPRPRPKLTPRPPGPIPRPGRIPGPAGFRPASRSARGFVRGAAIAAFRRPVGFVSGRGGPISRGRAGRPGGALAPGRDVRSPDGRPSRVARPSQAAG